MAQKTVPTSISGSAAVERRGGRHLLILPDDVSRALPSRGQVAVDAVLNGDEVSAVVEPDGRRGHWIGIGEALLARIGTEAGQTVDFTLTPSATWPEPDVPDDLAAALDHEPGSTEPWRDITPMARWEWVRWVNATKNADTRRRRIDVTVSKLLDGKRRPCCFDLSSCTDPELAKSGKLIGAP